LSVAGLKASLYVLWAILRLLEAEAASSRRRMWTFYRRRLTMKKMAAAVAAVNRYFIHQSRHRARDQARKFR
jgi:hypothetical protein